MGATATIHNSSPGQCWTSPNCHFGCFSMDDFSSLGTLPDTRLELPPTGATTAVGSLAKRDSRSRATSAAGGRWLGSFASIFRISASSCAGTNEFNDEEAGGSFSFSAFSVSKIDPVSKGWVPTASSESTIPSETTSLAGDGASPRDCSGDMYRKVPAGSTEPE